MPLRLMREIQTCGCSYEWCLGHRPMPSDASRSGYQPRGGLVSVLWKGKSPFSSGNPPRKGLTLVAARFRSGLDAGVLTVVGSCVLSGRWLNGFTIQKTGYDSGRGTSYGG